jgi:hypothetical protein
MPRCSALPPITAPSPPQQSTHPQHHTPCSTEESPQPTPPLTNLFAARARSCDAAPRSAAPPGSPRPSGPVDRKFQHTPASALLQHAAHRPASFHLPGESESLFHRTMPSIAWPWSLVAALRHPILGRAQGPAPTAAASLPDARALPWACSPASALHVLSHCSPCSWCKSASTFSSCQVSRSGGALRASRAGGGVVHGPESCRCATAGLIKTPAAAARGSCLATGQSRRVAPPPAHAWMPACSACYN